MPSFASFDGTKLVYDVEGDGPTVVLLHGFATDAYINWVRPGFVDRLVRANYRVVALDQRGHGGSDKPHDPQAYADGAMIQDASALLDHLGVERVFMVGYSMGAMNTARLITTDERVRAAVLGGVGGHMLQMREGAASIADAMTTDDTSTIDNPVAKSFRDFADLTGADKQALAAIQRQPRAPIGDLSGVSIPVLVICGDNDPMVGDPAELAAQIDGARSVVVGGTHLNVVNNPAFHEEVVSFLDEQEAG